MKKSKAVSNLTSLCLLAAGMMMLPNASQAAVSQAQTDQDLKKVLVEMQQLQQEVNGLNAEVNDLKRQNRNLVLKQSAEAEHRKLQEQVRTLSTQVVTKQEAKAEHKELRAEIHAIPKMNNQPMVKNPNAAQMVEVVPLSHPEPPHFQASRLTQGITVTTSPLLGLRSAYDASDLVVNISTMNEDLRLLQQRETLEQQLRAEGLPEFWQDRSLIELSGAIEGQGIIRRPFGGGRTGSDIDLTRAEFDTLAFFSPGVIGLISMTYDNSPLPPNVQGSGQRFANSRIFLKRGFVTLGDLHISPFYFSIGQMFLPFGDYTSEMLSNPLTEGLGQTNQRIALLGAYDNGLYAEGYLLNGDATTGTTSINNGGVNFGYKYMGDKFGANMGIGYLYDIADSLGMQKTSAPNGFQGFGAFPGTEILVRTVPGGDAHVELDIGKLTLLSEFVEATHPFSPANLSFNNEGAQPQALHTEGDYSFKIMDRFPTVFTLAYDHGWELLPLNLPKDSFIGEINTSFWKNTIETIEYRHDINYASSDVFGGNGAAVVNSVGGTQDMVTLQVGAYF